MNFKTAKMMTKYRGPRVEPMSLMSPVFASMFFTTSTNGKPRMII